MSGVNNFPDGVAPGSLGLRPNIAAPEALVPQQHGEDLSWVATNANRAPGIQPRTEKNPSGELQGLPLSVHL
jgi:hypothetical protein